MRTERKQGLGNQVSRQAACETKRYELLAIMAGLFLFGGFLLIEHLPLLHLAATVMFCIVCAGLLLFALMKMNVMEFQTGSFWDQLNVYVNRESGVSKRGVRTGRQAARSTVYAMIINK